MRTNYVVYDLLDGYIHNWLVAGPQEIPVNLEDFSEEVTRQKLTQAYTDPDSHITETPVERGPLTAGIFKIGDYTGLWEYYACQEDHWIDRSKRYPSATFLRSWAYIQLVNKGEKEVVLELKTFGPINIWLNSQHIFRSESFSEREPLTCQVLLRLKTGNNKLLARFENVSLGTALHAMSGRLCQPVTMQPAVDIKVRIPSLIKSIERRNLLEKVFQSLHLNQDVYIWNDHIRLHWPPEQEEKFAYAAVRLMAESGKIYAQAEVDGTPGDQLTMSISGQFPEGAYRLMLMPRLWEYYERDFRFTHQLSLWNLGRQQFSESPYGTLDERKRESFIYASRQEQPSVYREMAVMAVGSWEQMNPKVLLEAIGRIRQRQEGSILDLLGLLGILYRFGDHAQFPEALKAPLEEAILNYRYCPEDQGRDIMDFSGESSSLLFATCAILAGQRFPEGVFTRSGLQGKQIRQRGEEQVMSWLHQRAAWGFIDWGSAESSSEIIAALSHLIDLTENEAVWQLAGVMLDKIFFGIALSNFKGLPSGVSHRGDTWEVKGGLVNAVSGIMRLMWGQGLYTPHLAGLVSMSCNQTYQLPDLLTNLALNPLDEMWGRERHCQAGGEGCVDLASYKTPDYLMTSVQDYHPGEQGAGEHIWQAILGHGAVVFTNHPGSSSEKVAHLPGYWRGNGVLPRLAQWKDALIAVYNLPEAAGLPYTHAYFPTAAFDEYVIRDGWAFARKGNAYLGLTATAGINLTHIGHHAYRELHSPGCQNTWFCQMGRLAQDGEFVDFQEKVIALEFTARDLDINCVTLRGDRLEFGWEGSLLVNHEEQPFGGEWHYQNPYTSTPLPCDKMEIQVGEEVMRLDFSEMDDVS